MSSFSGANTRSKITNKFSLLVRVLPVGMRCSRAFIITAAAPCRDQLIWRGALNREKVKERERSEGGVRFAFVVRTANKQTSQTKTQQFWRGDLSSDLVRRANKDKTPEKKWKISPRRTSLELRDSESWRKGRGSQKAKHGRPKRGRFDTQPKHHERLKGLPCFF